MKTFSNLTELSLNPTLYDIIYPLVKYELEGLTPFAAVKEPFMNLLGGNVFELSSADEVYNMLSDYGDMPDLVTYHTKSGYYEIFYVTNNAGGPTFFTTTREGFPDNEFFEEKINEEE